MNDGYKTVLGFDVSSTCIGWCCLKIFNNEIKYSKAGFIKPPKDPNIIVRLSKTRKLISDILLTYKPDYIGIEDIIKFMKGASSANTITTLAIFNRMIGLLSYDFLNDKNGLKLFNVMTIRHGLKNNSTLPKKEDMPALVSQHLGIKFPYEYNKKGKIKIENYDMADSVAVALYYSFVLTDKIKKTKKVKKNATK